MRFADALGLELESIITLNPNQTVAYQSSQYRQQHMNMGTPTLANVHLARRFRITRNPNLTFFERANFNNDQASSARASKSANSKSQPKYSHLIDTYNSPSQSQDVTSPFEEQYETILLEQRQYNHFGPFGGPRLPASVNVNAASTVNSASTNANNISPTTTNSSSSSSSPNNSATSGLPNSQITITTRINNGKLESEV